MSKEYALDEQLQNMQQENLSRFFELGPGLRAGGIFVIAKHTSLKRVLLGGLGALGVGIMWEGMNESNVTYPGFDEAIEINVTRESIRYNPLALGKEITVYSDPKPVIAKDPKNQIVLFDRFPDGVSSGLRWVRITDYENASVYPGFDDALVIDISKQSVRRVDGKFVVMDEPTREE